MWSHKTGSRRGQVVARPVLTVHVNKTVNQFTDFFVCGNELTLPFWALIHYYTYHNSSTPAHRTGGNH